VIYESTVYPGCTEEDCVPVLEKNSGLNFNKDFFVGYSPERINPGDKEFYIKTKEGKVGEFYTTDKTEFFKAGNKITFGDLKKEDVVSVEADKKGKRLDPLKVTVK
jgi:UDP-N-acetyl-D-galactosamine dehydrogenase